MLTWQITLLFVMAGCAICCLLGICIAIDKLARGIFSIGAEITKMNAKLESIEVVNRDDPKKPMDQSEPDTSLEDLEAAISNLEKLERIDLTKLVGEQAEGDSGGNRQGEPTTIFSNRW